MKFLRSIAVSTLLLFSAVAHGTAQDWPGRPIKLIVPSGPGSANDVIARLLADDVSKRIGGTIFVENVAGAAGLPGHRAAATADPDGYTLLWTNTSGSAINPVTFKSLPYDPANDFDAVALVADTAPQVVCIATDQPFKSLPELVAYAKANPGKVRYAVDSTSGAAVFGARLLAKRADIKMAEVPYRAVAQLSQDVIAGRLPVVVTSIPAASAAIEAGKLRMVAVFSSKRFPALPDLPTVAETLPQTSQDGFFAVVAPKNTPKPIVTTLNKAIGEFINSPQTQARLTSFGVASSGHVSPAEAEEYIKKTRDYWFKIAEEMGIEKQ
jgi:tripartite-type tricarboxylate transporter receptor subunit TctC